MRASTKLKKMSALYECRFRYVRGEWLLYVSLPDNGEAVFSAKSFSAVVAQAETFLKLFA